MTSLLTHWKLDDRLKTLAFLGAGLGSTLSFEAGKLPLEPAAPLRSVGLMLVGYALSLAAVGLALQIRSRKA